MKRSIALTAALGLAGCAPPAAPAPTAAPAKPAAAPTQPAALATPIDAAKPAAATAAPAAAPTAAPGGKPVAAAPAKRPSSLLVGIWGGTWGEMAQEAFATPYEKETGVKIEFSYGGSAQRLAKLRAEKGRQTLDVAWWTPVDAARFSNESDELIPLKEKIDLLPNLQDVVERQSGHTNPEIWTEYNVQAWLYAWCILYRTDMIQEADARAVDSWNVFFEPKFKKKWGFPNINWGVGTQIMILAMSQGTGTIESGQPHEVEKAWELVPQLKDQVAVWYSSDDQAGQLIKAGEVPIIGIRSSQEAPNYQQQGLPINAILNLKEGLIGPGDSVGIVRTGDKAREDTAAEFINFCLAPEQQTAMSKFFFTPVNKKAKVLPEAEGKVLSAEQVANLKHIDRIWISTQYDGWVERWNKIIGS